MMQLDIKNLDFNYNDTVILDDISFSANAGEVLGIIGPNGSGKTTLLKCINGALKPKKGTIFLDEMDILSSKRKSIAKKIAMMPQISILFPFSVLDVVLMGRFAHIKLFDNEGPRDFDAVLNAMNLTNIYDLRNRSIDEISGGELQKVLIARSIAQEPEILLLDEPTSHLDPNHQLEILEIIRDLTKRRKIITILVSHDLNLAGRYCDRLLLLNKGKIVSIGATPEVLTPSNIKNVFNVDAEISYYGASQVLQVILFPILTNQSEESIKK